MAPGWRQPPAGAGWRRVSPPPGGTFRGRSGCAGCRRPRPVADGDPGRSTEPGAGAAGRLGWPPGCGPEARVARRPRDGARPTRRRRRPGPVASRGRRDPGPQQRVGRQVRGGVVGTPPSRARVSGSRGGGHFVPKDAGGMQQEEVDITGHRDGLEDRQVAGRQSGEAKQRQPRRQVQQVGVLGEPDRPGRGAAEPGCLLRCARGAGAIARLANLLDRAQHPGGADSPRLPPTPGSCRPVHAVVVIEIRQVANCGETPDPRRAPGGEAARKWAANETRNGSSMWASTSSRSGHTERSGGQGSWSGSTPLASAVARLTSVPGKGKAKLAHTPSPDRRPSPRPGGGTAAAPPSARLLALAPRRPRQSWRRPGVPLGHRPGSRPAGRPARICGGTATVTLLPCLAG